MKVYRPIYILISKTKTNKENFMRANEDTTRKGNSIDEFEDLLNNARKQARKTGLKMSDIGKAIKRVRKKQRKVILVTKVLVSGIAANNTILGFPEYFDAFHTEF